jgi:tetratricopeptide (TPR) repeat protein
LPRIGKIGPAAIFFLAFFFASALLSAADFTPHPEKPLAITPLVSYGTRSSNISGTPYILARDAGYTSYDLKIKEGKSFMARLSYPEAIECFERAIGLDSSRPEAYYYLAVIYERKQDYDKALLFWRKRSQLNPGDKRGKEAKEHFIFLSIVREREKFLENINLPEKLEKMHFVIYHGNYLYASKLVFKAENAYKKIMHDLGVVKFPFWDKFKCVLLLFPEKESYLAATSAPPWSGGIAGYNRFLFATFETAPGLEEKTLPHELAHLALQMFMGSDTPIPLWLNEGLAKYEEEGSRDYLTYTKQNLAKDKFFPLSELFSMTAYPQDDVMLFYAQSASVVYYLKEKNIASLFSQFLLKLKEGVEIDRALKDVYQWKFQNGVADLQRRWKKELD